MEDDFSFLDNTYLTAEEAERADPVFNSALQNEESLELENQNLRFKEPILQGREEMDPRLRNMKYQGGGYSGYGGYGGGYGGAGLGGYSGKGPGGYSDGYGGVSAGFGGGRSIGDAKSSGYADIENLGDESEDRVEIEEYNDEINLEKDEVVDGNDSDRAPDSDDPDRGHNQFLDSVKGTYSSADYRLKKKSGIFHTPRDPDAPPVDPHEWENTPPEYGGPEPPIFDRWPTKYEAEVMEEDIDRHLNPHNYASESDPEEFDSFKKDFDLPYKGKDPLAKDKPPVDGPIDILATHDKGEVNEEEQVNEESEEDKWHGLDNDLTESQAEELWNQNKNTEIPPEFDNLDVEKTLREGFIKEHMNTSKKKQYAQSISKNLEKSGKVRRASGTYHHTPTKGKNPVPEAKTVNEPIAQNTKQKSGRYYNTSTEDVSTKPEQLTQNVQNRAMTQRAPGTYYHLSTDEDEHLAKIAKNAQASRKKRAPGTYYHITTEEEGEDEVPKDSQYLRELLQKKRNLETQAGTGSPPEPPASDLQKAPGYGADGTPVTATGTSPEEGQPQARPRKAEWAEQRIREIEEKIAAEKEYMKEREAQMAAQGGAPPAQGYPPPGMMRPRLQSAAEIRAQMAIQKLARRVFGAARKTGKRGRPAIMFV